MSGQPLKLIDASNNCKHWSGQDALKWAADEVESSPAPVKKLLVLWYEPNDKQGSNLRYCVSGMTREEHIAMLQVFLLKTTQDFYR